MSAPDEIKALIRRLAGELGFCLAGIAPAAPAAHAGRFRKFLERGYHADMAWLDRDPDRRCDVRNQLDGAAAVICLACSYAPVPDDPTADLIARYARGRDYHRALKSRAGRLAAELAKVVSHLETRICVDSSPVLERELAAAAGLGWIGRNGCLLHAEFGSYLLLAEIVINLPLPADDPQPSRCGSCRACVEACPTGAICDDGLIDSRRCLSYLTIEHRREIPEAFRPAMAEKVFGCDVCQQVCPFNRHAPAGDAELRGPTELARTSLVEMLLWTGGDWDRLTRGSAARRAKFEMYLRNAAIAAGNAGADDARPALEHLVRHPWPMVAEAARWALRRLQEV